MYLPNSASLQTIRLPSGLTVWRCLADQTVWIFSKFYWDWLAERGARSESGSESQAVGVLRPPLLTLELRERCGAVGRSVEPRPRPVGMRSRTCVVCKGRTRSITRQ